MRSLPKAKGALQGVSRPFSSRPSPFSGGNSPPLWRISDLTGIARRTHLQELAKAFAGVEGIRIGAVDADGEGRSLGSRYKVKQTRAVPLFSTTIDCRPYRNSACTQAEQGKT